MNLPKFDPWAALTSRKEGRAAANRASSASTLSTGSDLPTPVPSDSNRTLTDAECDAPSMRPEPLMPPLGTPERDRLTAEHAAMVACLCAVAQIRPCGLHDGS